MDIYPAMLNFLVVNGILTGVSLAPIEHGFWHQSQVHYMARIM